MFIFILINVNNWDDSLLIRIIRINKPMFIYANSLL